MKQLLLMGVSVIALSGCAFNLSLMPRDSGKVYSGTMNGNGAGGGSMSLTIDGDVCTGPVQRVSSNESVAFANTFSTNARRPSSSFTTIVQPGDTMVKGLLTCSSGKGIRCEIVGRAGVGGGGICTDDTGRIYDLIAAMK